MPSVNRSVINSIGEKLKESGKFNFGETNNHGNAESDDF
jgi:hypothetical protein